MQRPLRFPPRMKRGVISLKKPINILCIATRYVIGYILWIMIIKFKHKGLKKLFDSGSIAGIQSEHVIRLRRILALLETAESPDDMDLPGLRLHPLKGDRDGTWSVSVSGNWRVTFQFQGSNVTNVDYDDYH